MGHLGHVGSTVPQPDVEPFGDDSLRALPEQSPNTHIYSHYAKKGWFTSDPLLECAPSRQLFEVVMLAHPGMPPQEIPQFCASVLTSYFLSKEL